MARNIKNINVEIGQRIKRLRSEMKLTREGLAERSGYTANFIQEVERGRSGLSSESIRAFSQALNVSTDQILLGSVPDDFSFIVEKLKVVPPEKLPYIIDIINAAVECAK